MKTLKTYFTIFAAAALLAVTSSCTADLDQYPHTETTSQNVYTTVGNYEAVLGKIYASMVTNGQGKGGDNADLTSNMGFDYMRYYFNMQECGTDEVASTWLTGDKTADISYISWDADDPWVADMYYRIYWNITLTNEFLRNCSDSKIAEFDSDDQTKLRRYRAEARFMRALFYYHALDLYRYIPFVSENDPVGSFTPPRYTPQQTFDFIESELKDIVTDLAPASSCPYGEASQGAAYTLLAKLYLNSEVYTGTEKYSECIAACSQAIAQGYSLEADYSKLFNADNDKRTNEIIFALPVDPTHTVSWGATTYIICGEVSNTSDDQKPADYGVTSGWGMFRARGELPEKFTDGNRDKRYMFFTTNQTQDIEDMTDQSNGFFVEKWTNLTDNGEAASNSASDGCATDYPLFRLADVYLMFAESVLRGGTGGDRSTALGYVNELRKRAYGDDSGNITDGQLTTTFVLKERAR